MFDFGLNATLINGDNSDATGAVTVASGGTLGGTKPGGVDPPSGLLHGDGVWSLMARSRLSGRRALVLGGCR